MPHPDILDFPAEHVVDPAARRPLLARAGGAAGYVALSLALNLAVVAWLARIGWPLRPAEATAPISVELVDHMPGEGSGSGKPKGGSGPDTPVSSSDDKQASAETAAKPEPASSKRAEPEKAVEPVKPVKPADKPPTPQEAAVEADDTAAPMTEAPSAPQPPTPATAPPSTPVPPRPGEAVPPSPEHPDASMRPQLVEAPKLPARPAATPPSVAASEPAPAKGVEPPSQPSPPSAQSPPAPAALTTPSGAEAVPPPALPVAKPHVPTAEEKRQAEATAKLAAILPFGAAAGLSPFGTQLGGPDQSATRSYRAQVYGNFSKGNDLIAAAREKGMRGQTVVSFSIDDRGNLASLGVAVSSGKPDVDATALELIRRAAPFPPPPPGVQRSFSPAIGFGLDE